MRRTRTMLRPLALTGLVLGVVPVTNALPSGARAWLIPPHQKVLAENATQTKPAEASKVETRAETAPKSAEKPLPQATDEEKLFVELANKERAKRGMGELTIDPLLIAVARQHSGEMRDRAYFSHQSPVNTNKTPMDRYLIACSTRPAYACVGENLFYCSVTDVFRGHSAFMNSPKHRENILFDRFEKIGVGIVKNEKGEFWVTQMFLTNTDQSTAVAKKMSSR
jgi:uncharacterized protein YkwD